jgi:hypothetical protein
MPHPSDTIRYMHAVTGRYHTHYSLVRVLTTALVLPIGLFTTIYLLDHCSTSGRFFPAFFVIFILSITIATNLIFSRWSRACRRIERYYEKLIEQDAVYNAEIHGFRHIFRKVIIGSGGSMPEPPNFPRPLTWKPRDWHDTFTTSILAFAAAYFVIYIIALSNSCG